MFSKLDMCNTRVDSIEAFHNEQKRMFTELSASNMEAIKLHTEVKRVFKDESEAFFSERLKWKSDVKK